MTAEHKEHVVCPASGLGMLGVVHFRAVAELVSPEIRELRFAKAEIKWVNAQLWQRKQFGWLRDPVVILVLPKTELREDRIANVDYTAAITAIFRFVEFCERQESVRPVRLRLFRDIPKHLFSAIDEAIAVAVQNQ